MALHKIVHLCGVIGLTTGTFTDHSSCFNTVSRLIPDDDGYITTLAFSVLNTCLEGESDLESVKVFRGGVHQQSTPICLVKYDNGNCQMALGCTCSTSFQTVSIEKHFDTLGHDVWILKGELTNGVIFNETVAFNVEPARTSRQTTRGCPGRPLSLRSSSPRAQNTGSQQFKPDQSKRHFRPRSAHVYVDMDNIEALADIKEDDYLHAVSSAEDQRRWHCQKGGQRGAQPRSPMCDDDGYLLVFPPPSHDTEGQAAKPSYANSTV